MKKLPKSALLFIIAAVLILAGLASKPLAGSVINNSVNLLKRNISVSKFIDNIEAASAKNLSYYNFMMDLNSLRLRLTGTDVVKKDDKTVIRMTNGYLTWLNGNTSSKKIKSGIENLKILQDKAESNGSEFLYVMCPEKGYFGEYPTGYTNYARDNMNETAKAAEKAGVNYLNLSECMNADGLNCESSYFITDHHWKPETGLYASGKICQTLSDKYGFSFNSDYTDISNYNIKTYENWFLGSQGKKVGKYFTSKGVDDINIITPKSDTSFKMEIPSKGVKKSGSFEEVLLEKKNIEKKDMYTTNPYATYSGGDFRMQIIRNNNNTKGKTFLVIRDSYACVVTPFLAMNAKEVHVADIRDTEGLVGDKINIEKYIKKINPDYVLVLYNGCANGNDIKFSYLGK